LNQAKRRKIEKLQGLLAAGNHGAAESEREDLKVLKELEQDVSLEELKAYMVRQRVKTAALEEKANDPQEINPFSLLSTDRLAELTEHRHKIVAQGAQLELAQRNFFYFCHLRAPDFYKPDRDFLVRLCNEMQEFYEGPERVLIVNLPPRHGKSRTAGLFEQWVFGKNAAEQIMTGSYNEKLSTTFSKAVRNGIAEEKTDPSKIIYSDIFPDVRIQRGEAAMNFWALEGQYASYLATSPEGTATGFGATIMVIDDLIKRALEAFNADLLDEQWRWFTDTMLSRLESGGKIIIIMTRWATGDLAGRAEKHFKGLGFPCRVLSMKALVNEETKEMLCPDILSYEDYQMKVSTMSKEIASANYQQIPVDMKGRLYQKFQTYAHLPTDEQGRSLFTAIRAYCDTADEGTDYLCNIIYGVYLDKAYILDVYYTKEAMEITEVETARRLYRFKVRDADIESNNGGRGFARNVKRILKEKFGWISCVINWFHQSQNKRARILTNASGVQNNLLFPVDWKERWPEYHDAMFTYQREGKNKHDDAPDATTGVDENLNKASVTIRLLGDSGDDEDEMPEDEQDPDAGTSQEGGFLRRIFDRFNDSRHDGWC